MRCDTPRRGVNNSRHHGNPDDSLFPIVKRKGAFVSARKTAAFFRSRIREDRGDVPGWVLITLMTAGLVIIIWALAAPALSGVFEQAIDRVVGF